MENDKNKMMYKAAHPKYNGLSPRDSKLLVELVIGIIGILGIMLAQMSEHKMTMKPQQIITTGKINAVKSESETNWFDIIF